MLERSSSLKGPIEELLVSAARGGSKSLASGFERIANLAQRAFHVLPSNRPRAIEVCQVAQPRRLAKDLGDATTESWDDVSTLESVVLGKNRNIGQRSVNGNRPSPGIDDPHGSHSRAQVFLYLLFDLGV